MPVFALPLALFALSALPLLAAVYFLSSRYQKRVVSSLILWPKDALPKGGGRKTSRFRSSWLFLLELLILVLLALAAAGPMLGLAAGRRQVCVVLDDCVAMRAHDGGGVSARARAEESLLKELEKLGRWEVHLVVAGPQPRAVGAASTPEALRELLGAPSDPKAHWACLAEAGDLPAALTLVGQTAPPGAVSLVLTDRAAPADLPAGVRWIATGRPLANLALTAAARGKDGQGGRTLVEISNFAPAAARAQVVVEQHDGKGGWLPSGSSAVSLAAGARETLVLRTSDAATLRVRLAGSAMKEDALDEDNAVVLLPEPERVLKAKVEVADEKLRASLGRALAAAGVVQVAGGEHLLVSDAPVPLVPEAGAAGTEGKAGEEAPAMVPASPVRDVWELRLGTGKNDDACKAFTGPFILNRAHPATRGLSLDGVVWAVPPAGLQAQEDDEEVIGLGDRPLLLDRLFPGGEHRLRMALAPQVSTLDQTPAFPIFLANLADWRLSCEPGLRRVNVRQGESVRIAVPPLSAAAWQLAAPGAPPVEWPSRPVEIPVARAGLYSFRPAGGAGDSTGFEFSVNLCNANASDVRQGTDAQAGKWPDQVKTQGRFQLSFALILLSLGLLMLHARLMKKGAEQ